MIFISKHLDREGIFIFNNYRNFWSLPYIMRRFTFRSDGFGMTHSEILNLLNMCNLQLIETKSVGIFTDKEKDILLIGKL